MWVLMVTSLCYNNNKKYEWINDSNVILKNLFLNWIYYTWLYRVDYGVRLGEAEEMPLGGIINRYTIHIHM